uniref:Uncharacterized protein n=1 Tax=Palpitomonas bilix TaxID=652834 RepID=A0A7S3D840_9EUKA|mmetsp:Transcript_26358/g.67195  ORF Transcript_26358/g.67195 Transcript_26358/m.67195 type:complete len:405 (+) Transcript_26358:172-1386(+)
MTSTLPALANSRLYGVQMREAGKKYSSFDPSLQSVLFASEAMRAEVGRDEPDSGRGMGSERKGRREKGAKGRKKPPTGSAKKQKRHPYLDSAAIAYRASNHSAPPSLGGQGRLPAVKKGRGGEGGEEGWERSSSFEPASTSYSTQPGDVRELREREKELERQLRMLMRGGIDELPQIVKRIDEQQSRTLRKYGSREGEDAKDIQGRPLPVEDEAEREEGGPTMEISSGGMELWEGHAIVYEEAGEGGEGGQSREIERGGEEEKAGQHQNSGEKEEEGEGEGRGVRSEEGGEVERGGDDGWERAQRLDDAKARAEAETASMLHSLAEAERRAEEEMSKLSEEAEKARTRENEVILGSKGEAEGGERKEEAGEEGKEGREGEKEGRVRERERQGVGNGTIRKVLHT